MMYRNKDTGNLVTVSEAPAQGIWNHRYYVWDALDCESYSPEDFHAQYEALEGLNA